MAQITEVGKVGGVAYGVAFIACRCGEVAGESLEMEDRDAALSVVEDAARRLSDAGYDYDYCSDFRAYNGGARSELIDPVYYVADVGDDGERDRWRVTWQRGAGHTDIPAAIVAAVEAVLRSAWGEKVA